MKFEIKRVLNFRLKLAPPSYPSRLRAATTVLIWGVFLEQECVCFGCGIREGGAKRLEGIKLQMEREVLRTFPPFPEEEVDSCCTA